jgi:tight adherence protein B
MKRLFLLFAPLLVLAGLLFDEPASAQPAQEGTDELEVMLAIDASGSMEWSIGAAKAAAIQFVLAMPADVRIGIETFGDDVTVLSSPTIDRALLSAQINQISTGGDTALYDAVVAAGQQFTPTVAQRVLVVLSDGKDEGSAATLEQAKAAVQGVHVEAISLTTSETDLASLRALGQVTPAGDALASDRVAGLLTEAVAAATTTTATPTTTVAPTTTAAPTTTVAPTTTGAPASTAAPVTGVSANPPSAGSAADASESPTRLWLGVVGVFAGLFVLGLVLFPRQRVTKARLGIRNPRNVSDIGRRTTSAVEEALERHGKRADLATALSLAEISATPGEFVATVAIVALVAGLIGLFLGGVLVALLAAAVVCLGVRLYVRHSTTKRQTAFADQLPDVLQLITTALRSGYGLTQALESVAEEAEEPARSEIAHVLVESRMGRDLSDAMHALADRMDSKDLEWVVSAIDINRETGGNLSEILNTVAVTIRERQRMSRHVRTLTAEGRLSARILTVLPLAMMLWQRLVNPESFALLTHGVGLVALVAAGVLVMLGSIWVRRIVTSIAL